MSAVPMFKMSAPPMMMTGMSAPPMSQTIQTVRSLGPTIQISTGSAAPFAPPPVVTQSIGFVPMVQNRVVVVPPRVTQTYVPTVSNVVTVPSVYYSSPTYTTFPTFPTFHSGFVTPTVQIPIGMVY
eukprot:2059130-Rhodomonas_salina.2